MKNLKINKNELVGTNELANNLQGIEEKLIAYRKLTTELKTFEDNLKIEALELMQKHDIKKFSNQFLEITKIDETYKKIVNTNKLKENGLYEQYTTLTPVKASVRFKWLI